MTILDEILEFIAPRHCLLSGEKIDSCIFSSETLEMFYKDNLIINKDKKLNPVTRSISLFPSSDTQAMALVHKMKYYGKSHIAYELGLILGEKIIKESSIFHGYDFIIPVPVHRTRMRERTYNQSEWLAIGISEKLRISAPDNIIWRNRYTNSQTLLDAKQRPENVRSAFSLNKKFDVSKIKNKSILLCDDVITSGSTLRECALVLESLSTRINAVSICTS